MKRFLFVTLILLTIISLWSRNIALDSEIDIGFEYDSNVIRLSDDDQDEFLDSDNPDKYLISSLDDMIMNMTYSLKLKHYFFAGHTQIDEFKLNFDKYLENSVKDTGYLSYGIRQYFNSKLNMSLRYYFYPQIYVRQYHSVLDDGDEYHEFEYSKNYYTMNLNWDVQKHLDIKFELQYSQLFFNKWFTEYDADILTSNIYLNWQPVSKFELLCRYGWRISDTDAEDAFNDPSAIDVIKDAAYSSNIYALDLKFRKMPGKTTLNLGYKLETRFFDSEYEDDTYHYNRNDYIHVISTSLYKSLHKRLSLLAKAEYGFRNTESPAPDVATDKEYNYWNAGITLSYDIKLR
ncbi:MAG: hypothetical protein RAO94_11390 [Candidatus Stygibacter australis]|nr:hypothetical protein [Candidatus Stygibacter australis]MDP8322943.1 hypothetical protein [Candidatus Stygibacter australis]